MALPRLFLLLILPTLLVFSPARAALANVTIDDTDPAFIWTEDVGSPRPTIPWAAITPATPCAYCSAQPQTDDIVNKTWHDGTNNSAGSFTFQGSAVYIYGIDLANPANISFTMGDVTAFHYYAGTEQFIFKALFFSATDLTANVNHTVSWVLHATTLNGTVGLFDYALVTVDASTTTPSGTAAPASSSSSSSTSSAPKSKSKTGPIVGGVLGGLALIALITGGVVFLTRRRRQRPADGPADGDTDAPRHAARVRADYVRPFVGVEPPPLSPSGEKTLDVSWTNPPPVTAPSHDAPTSPSQTGTATSPSQTDAASTTAPSSTARERVLEERLALLEAQVNEHLPPAYGAPPP
ncbi:hypothetical protein DFH09DRAFT_1368564 [Mycena vulgaris]|nr:hypothetical protein DFH09DRAFT_1368564 [Mycena vulgaris]